MKVTYAAAAPGGEQVLARNFSGSTDEMIENYFEGGMP